MWIQFAKRSSYSDLPFDLHGSTRPSRQSISRRERRDIRTRLRSCLVRSLRMTFQYVLVGACIGSGWERGALHAADPKPAQSATSYNTANAEVCFVNLATASVYCGPDKTFYATEELARGDSVDVYYRTKDGWCAIRPPKGSHGWLAAERAYLLPGGKKAEVVGQKTPAWIGSSRLNAKDRLRWQIELQPTQQVDVIGETNQAIDSDKVRLWYKILPPPGEFRWIRAEALANQPPSLRNANSNTKVAEQARPVSMIQQAVANQPSVVPGDLESSNPPPPIPIPDANIDPPTTSPSVSPHSMMPSQSEPIIVGQPERIPQVGEYIEGQGTVISSSPAPWINENVRPLSESFNGQMVEGQIYDGQVYDGEIVMDSEGIPGETWHEEGATTPCPSCNQTGCTKCNAAHQSDSMDYWASNQCDELPPIRYRPLGRLLGLIGISVVEGESVVDPNCCGRRGCRCEKCLQHPTDLNPRSSSRFGHLPRPTRNLPRPLHGEWLGDNQSDTGSRSLLESNLSRSRLADNYRSSSDSSLLDSTLERSSSSRDWQGLSSARYRNEVADDVASNNLGNSTNDWPNRDRASEPIVGASAEGESIKFSTPEIQSAMNDLTRRVAEPMVSWEFRALASDAQRWIDQAADPIARGEARLLMERIEQFEILRRRSLGQPENAIAMAPAIPSIERISVPSQSIGFQRPADELGIHSTPSPSPINGIDGGGAVQRNPDGTLASDASGWLVEVFSAQPGQPEFALTDDHGGLIAYVQPAPGMNLRRYVKQPVGIYGARGYLPTLGARQIVAERIVRLR
jgi:hypothetical protein